MTEDQKNCTARMIWNDPPKQYSYRTESCKTKQPLIDNGGNLAGDRDDYICPDCNKYIQIYRGS
jgi:transposase-like protein